MVTLSTIISALEQWNGFSALELQDTYFHVTIHPPQYKVLPFGISKAPRVFSKILVVLAAHLHKQGIVIFPYLNECLLKAPSGANTLEAIKKNQIFFSDFDFQINRQKLVLMPGQNLEFIAVQLDAIKTRAFLPAHRFSTIVSLVSTVRTSPQISAKSCLQLLGYMAVATFVVKHARLYLCWLQGWLQTVYVPHRHSLNKLNSFWYQLRSRTC